MDKTTGLALAEPGEPVPPSHHGRCRGRWPLRYPVTLRAEPVSVSRARAEVDQCLARWGAGAGLREDAALVVSELVTNTVHACALLPGALVHVALGAGSDGPAPGWVLVAVADPSVQCPLRLGLDPGARSGRGLALVEALSTRWGWHPVACSGLRKVVWAEWSQT